MKSCKDIGVSGNRRVVTLLKIRLGIDLGFMQQDSMQRFEETWRRTNYAEQKARVDDQGEVCEGVSSFNATK